MITLHGLSWDEVAVVDLFSLLNASGQGELMERLAVAACHAVALRNADAKGRAEEHLPLDLTVMELYRCRPQIPHGWSADEYLADEVANQLVSRLAGQAVRMVLTTEDHDQANAAILANWIDESAKGLGWHDEMAKACPGEAPVYVNPEQVVAFLRDWRSSFMANLMRTATRRA